MQAVDRLASSVPPSDGLASLRQPITCPTVEITAVPACELGDPNASASSVSKVENHHGCCAPVIKSDRCRQVVDPDIASSRGDPRGHTQHDYLFRNLSLIHI